MGQDSKPGVGRAGLALLLAGTFFWATNFTAVRLLVGEMGPFGLSFWRWLMACLPLYCLFRRTIHADLPALRRHWKVMVLLAFLSIFASNTFTYSGLQTSTALNASILQASAPAIVLLVSLLAFADRAAPLHLLGVAISTLGVLLIAARGSLGVLLGLDFHLGDLLLFGGVATYAIYTPLLRLRPPVHQVTFLFCQFALASLMFLPCYLVEQHFTPAGPPSAKLVATLVYMAIFPALLSHFCFNRAIILIGANRAGQFQHLVPLFGVVLAMLLLGEQLQKFHVAGMALILGGLAVAGRARRV